MLGSGFHTKQNHMETNSCVSNFCIVQTLKVIELRLVKVACYFFTEYHSIYQYRFGSHMFG